MKTFLEWIAVALIDLAAKLLEVAYSLTKLGNRFDK